MIGRPLRAAGRRFIFAMACLALLAWWPAFAVAPGEMLPDPAQERRARDVSAGLRCLVCQNQSIDDSDASLAQDLRLLVRERIKAGDDDEAVRAFLVARYGPYILLRPPVSAATFLLWFTPCACLLAGGLVAAAAMRRRRAGLAAAGLDSREREAVDRILQRAERGG